MSNPARGYRDDSHCMKGFNLCVLDIDGGVSIPMVELLLADYKYMLYTTKRHTEEKNRFRLILPMSHILKLSKEDYKEFMKNIYNFLPFELDDKTSDRPRKWLTNTGKYSYHEGNLLDVLPFIPKTKEADKRKKVYNTYVNLTNLERWVVANAENTGRNNILLRYAYTCIDLGQDTATVKTNTLNLNSKLDKPLNEMEIHKSIFVSVDRKITERDTK